MAIGFAVRSDHIQLVTYSIASMNGWPFSKHARGTRQTQATRSGRHRATACDDSQSALPGERAMSASLERTALAPPTPRAAAGSGKTPRRLPQCRRVTRREGLT